MEAVTGCKTIAVRLFRDINMATNVIKGYRARAKAESWAEWTTDNPELAKLLEQAHKESERWQM